MAIHYTNEYKLRLNTICNLPEIAGKYTELQKVGNGYVGLCPNPNHRDVNASFRIDMPTDKNPFYTWRCFGCHQSCKTDKDSLIKNKNYGTDPIAFFQWINSWLLKDDSFHTAIVCLAKATNTPLPDSQDDALYKEKEKECYLYINNLKSSLLAQQYLANRGLSEQDMTDWKIGFDYYGSKICFPLMDRNKFVIGFTKRWLNPPPGVKDKYNNGNNTAIFNKSSFFYGLHNIKVDSNEIRITEGTMDVILAHKYGVKNVVAILGTAFTNEHVEIIKKMGKVPVFILDGDKAGIDKADAAINKLAVQGIYSKILIIPNDMDLCDLSLIEKDNIENYIQEHSLTYGQYMINPIITEYHSKVMELRLKYYNVIMKTLDLVPYEQERVILKSLISENLNIQF